jgi:ketosteroid isomerase-like protein
MKLPILDMEKRRFKAICDADIDLLNDFLHDSLVYAHTSGNVETKTDFIEALASGKRRYSQFDVIEASVRESGDLAITHGVAQCLLVSKGVTKDFKIRYLSCMLFERGRWQLVNWQSTITT